MAFIRRRVHSSGRVTYCVVFKDPRGRWRERAAGPRRKDAEVLLRRLLEEVAGGTFEAPREDPAFAEFAARFLHAKKETIKPSTYKDYAEVLRNHLIPFFGKLRLSEITPLKVQDFLMAMQDKGTTPATVGKIYRVLKVILRYAISLDLIDRDPTLAIKPPRVEREEMRFLTPEEVNILLEAVDGDARDILSTAVFSGLRQGELLALRWRDIDFEAGVIRVTRSYHSSGGFSDLKTSASRRNVPMIPRLASILRARHEAKGRPDPEDLVFPSAAGTPLDRHNLVSRIFEPALERAGLKRIRFHDLRHTYASLCIAAGMDPKALQRAMGHSSISVTMDTYAHLFPGSFDRAVKRMEGLLSRDSKVIRFPERGEKSDGR